MEAAVPARAPTRFARVAAAAGVILVTGALGFMGAFSDLGPGETRVLRMAALAVAYLVGGGLVGLLLPKRWYLAVLTAWGPVALGCLGLAAKRIQGGEFPRTSLLLVVLVGVPAFALASGRLGRFVVLHGRSGP